MPTPITMPEAGESVVSGILSSWLKNDGDRVERDETVAEVETDKITVELLAPASGVLKRTVSEGDEIEIGQAVGEVDENGDGGASSNGKASGDRSEGGAEGGGEGGEESKDTDSDKSESESKSGSDKQSKPEPKTENAPPAEPHRPEASGNGGGGGADVRATPLARKLAQEHGADLSKIEGTGPGGRVREQDVLDFVKKPAGKTADKPDTREAQKPAPARSAPAAATSTSGREVSVERMSPLRKMVASRLVEAQQTAAMLTTFNECDMSAVMALRKQYKEAFAEQHGINLGFMSFFVKACVRALQKFPLVNAYIVEQDGKPAIQKHHYQDVAIAVASPKGLVVPVIRDCQSLSFADIENAIKDFGTRAKDGKLELEEMQGGTFTITNGGVFGSLLSTPILNPPQSGILGMHGIKNRAVEDPGNPGQIVLRPMMYLALSYDHRIVDGAEAVQFLVSIKDSIEDPRRLMLDL
ncbi:MAG: 2-oxoglutarate dehydrogenase complex dihydrolipoyllysine-residue succinyltransferase [Phycisphaerales bacterium JB040]